MRVVSLFAGIGGFDLALSRYGHEIVFANEWDKYAGDIYDKRFTHKIDRRDITTVDAATIPDHDILVGGFPCQAFSVAGKRRGFDDTRGTLFFDIARILESKRPSYFILENVKGLLSHDQGNTIRIIFQALDELGYDLQWQVLNSKDFGVPQNRERIFIVGHLRGIARPEVFPFTGEVRQASEARKDEQSGAKNYIATRHLGRNGSLVSPISATVQASEVPHVTEPLLIDAAYPGREPRIYDEVAPTVVDYGSGGNKMPIVVDSTIGTINRGKFKSTGSHSLALTATYYKGHDNHGARPMVLVPEATKMGYAKATVGDSINLSQPNSKTRRGRVGKGVANTLDTGMHQYTPSLPSKKPDEVANTVRSGGRGSTTAKHAWDLVEDVQLRIHRLTPTECERLQGFPDGWTAEGINGSISDTQRYKCLGNAVTVNVVEAIVSRLPR